MSSLPTDQDLELTTARPEPDRRPRKPSFIKRILPRTLLGRSLLIIVSPLVLVQVIATWIFYDRHYDTTTKRLAEGVAGDIAAIIRIMGPDPDAAQMQDALLLAKISMWLDVSFQEGERLPENIPPPGWSILDQKLTKALRGRMPYAFRIDTDTLPKKVLIEVQQPRGVLSVLVPRQRLFSSTTYIFIMWMVGSSIVLFGVATLFMRNQVKPIRRLAVAAESFGKGRDVPNFKPEGATEVRQAAWAFLQMRGRIKRQIQQRTEMLAGVSHDLRTPLTRMKLQLAMLGDSPEGKSLASDVTEMERMVEGYLAFARGEGSEAAQPTDLSELLSDVVGQMKREDRPVTLDLEPDLVVPLRPAAMRRCLSNLVTNAQRYANSLTVRAVRLNRVAEVIFDDDGPGIPAELRDEAFKPFSRLERSRNPSTGGTGLGLTIARDVVRSHGGDLLLEEAPEGGLRARLWLPL